nr:hypothetical protein [Candidatus Epulopiscium viviparus]
MSRIELGKFRTAKLMQLKKAPSPIVTILSGIVNSVIEEQRMNARVAI